uniref:C2H2-type domain-containing protein n=1 Tax=Phytophthora ramorum TaxID=164328 RepID=H3GFR8_PHYRM
MDLDAGADDFFAALNNGAAEDVFAGFGAAEAAAHTTAATGGRATLDDEPLVMVDKKKKAEAAKKAAKREAAARAAAAKAARQADEPALPMEERIVNLLVPELKVNDVMLLIRKMKQADYARGDTICNGVDGNGCGTVVQDHIVHEGSAYQFVEMNLSQMGKDERRTRIGYKDQMKQKACRLIDHTMSNLDLHEIVGSRAKKMFAEFRDVREHVHQFDAMVAGCVIAAYMETSKEMYSAQNGIRIGQNKQAGIANLALLPNKAVDEKKLHPFTCPLCDMKFNARRGMQFHKCAGKPDDDKEKKSTGTDLAPMVMPDELQPIIEMKNGKTWFKCPVCSRVYGKEESLSEHMVRHKNQSKKRKHHIETSTIDSTRLMKTTKLASANPSVQVNTHEQVMFRGEGRRVWLQHLTEE